MVFFCCDGCGESVKKNQVEKHTFRCRSQSFSCIDCNVNFTKTSYANHIKCITEDQKYGGKKFEAKMAKGEVKQSAWIEQVQAAMDNVSHPALKQLLIRIRSFGNIPRKEAKFVNFLLNSVGVRDRGLCEKAWAAIAHETNKSRQTIETGQKDSQKVEEIDKKKEEKSNQSEIISEQDQHTQQCENGEDQDRNDVKDNNKRTFKWKAAIKRKLKGAGGEMKLKRLRSEVLAEYSELLGDGRVVQNEEYLKEIFSNKLATAGVCLQGKLALLPS